MMTMMTEQLEKRKSSGLTQAPGLSSLIPKLANVIVYMHSTHSDTAIHLKQLMVVVIPRFSVNFPKKIVIRCAISLFTSYSNKSTNICQ